MVAGGRASFDRVRVELPVWRPDLWGRTNLFDQALKVQEEAAEVEAAAARHAGHPDGELSQALAIETLDVIQAGFTLLGMLAMRDVDLQNAFRAFLEKNQERGYYSGSYSGHQWEHLFDRGCLSLGVAKGARLGPKGGAA